MAGRWRCLCFAAVLFCLSAATAAAADSECTTKVSSYSQLLGTKKSGAQYVDHMKLAKKGRLQSVSLYFQKSSGCLRGAKVVFGTTPNPGMIGSSVNTTEAALKLKPGETVTKAEYKNKQCIEYVKLTTNTGRSVSVGSATAPGTLVKTAANKTGNSLITIRGYQGSADGKPGALQQLQFVWGTSQCPEALSAETGKLNDDPAVCAPRMDMCNQDASMNQFSYCVWNAPYKTSACRGGCCISSGKCASSSCAISGIGRDVANMICYGTNSGFGFGGSNLCSGLACKLEVPGCTTDAFGGNCVGSVVAVGDESEIFAEAKRYLGAPCLDATPSDITLDADGSPAGLEGMYMSKLWTICDCSDDPSFTVSPAAMLLNLTTSAVNNVTKNDVLLAISQVLPKVNLSETLDPTKMKDNQLFPSFTDFFKMPTMPTITLPSFITANTSSNSNSSAVEIKLPDLKQLLSSLAAKASNASAAVNAAVDPAPAVMPDVTGAAVPVTAKAATSSSNKNGTKNLAETLEGLKGFLGKLGSNLNKANITASSSRSSSDAPKDSSSSSSSSSAPVSVAALPATATPAEPALIMPAAMDPVPTQTTPPAAALVADQAQRDADVAAQQEAPAAAAAASTPSQPSTSPAEPGAAQAAATAQAGAPPAAVPAAVPAEAQLQPQLPDAASAVSHTYEAPAAATEAVPAPSVTSNPAVAAAEAQTTPEAVSEPATPAEATATPEPSAAAPAPQPAEAAATPEPSAAAPAPQPAEVPPPVANTAGAFKGFSGSASAIQQILGLLPPEAFMPYDYDQMEGTKEGSSSSSSSGTPADAAAA